MVKTIDTKVVFQSTPSVQLGAVAAFVKFHHIANTCQTKLSRFDGHTARNEDVAPLFGACAVMGVLVHELTADGQHIFCPLLFNMDQCPLTSAKDKMLYSRNVQQIVVCHHTTSSGVRSGRLPS